MPPSGIGIYLRNLTPKYGTPEKAAKKCADHGVSFVALMGPWLDDTGEKRLRPKTIDAEFGQAMAEEDVDVWVWGYPDAGKENAFVESMVTYAKTCGAVGLLLDPEKSYKGNPRAVDQLISTTLDALDESLDLGVTSFGRLDWHNLPGLKGVGWSSPQLYTVSSDACRKAIATWQVPGAHIVPSVPAYGPNSEGELDVYLEAMHDLVKGYIVWSWPQISAQEWRTIQAWSNRF